MSGCTAGLETQACRPAGWCSLLFVVLTLMSLQYLHNCSLHCDRNEEVSLTGITYFPPPRPAAPINCTHPRRQMRLSTAHDRSILTHLYNLKFPVHLSQILSPFVSPFSPPFLFFIRIQSQALLLCFERQFISSSLLISSIPYISLRIPFIMFKFISLQFSR